jgi:hypothetical protein
VTLLDERPLTLTDPGDLELAIAPVRAELLDERWAVSRIEYPHGYSMPSEQTRHPCTPRQCWDRGIGLRGRSPMGTRVARTGGVRWTVWGTTQGRDIVTDYSPPGIRKCFVCDFEGDTAEHWTYMLSIHDRDHEKSITDDRGGINLGALYPTPEYVEPESFRTFRAGQRFGVRGTPYDATATSIARHRYWQDQGLTFDQAGDVCYFEANGRGPWRGLRMREERLREVAIDLADSCRRAGFTPLDCLVRHPIEVRSRGGGTS